jgi:hypothetical protein
MGISWTDEFAPLLSSSRHCLSSASISLLSEIPFSKMRDALNVALREVCLLVEMCGSKNKKEIDTGGMCGCVLWLLLSISEREKTTIGLINDFAPHFLNL